MSPSFLDKVKHVYDTKYKTLMLIPIILVVLAFVQLGYQYATTGDVVSKGISLKGGSTILIPYNSQIQSDTLLLALSTQFSGHEFSVRQLTKTGVVTHLALDSDLQDQNSIDGMIATISQQTGIASSELSAEIVGEALGKSFFKQTFKSLLVAFVLMGMIVFLYFGDKVSHKVEVVGLSIVEGSLIWWGSSWVIGDILAIALGVLLIILYIRYSIPSAAVVAAGFSDIVVTLAIFNLTGEKLSTAGVAAFLMLIGYSVDTDMLLTNRVLKRTTGELMEKIYGAIQTGMTMICATFAAVLTTYVLVQSEIIKQIMLILLIGLVVDVIMTWIQNVAFLRLYLEHQDTKRGQKHSSSQVHGTQGSR